MHNKFVSYSRDSQELIYWLINDYACKLQEIEVGQTASDYYRYTAKKQLKKLYLKHTGIKLKELNPFQNIYSEMRFKIEDIMHKDISENSKVETILNDMDFLIRQELQKLTLALDGTFSLSLKLMSQEKANRFIQWLFDYMLAKDIPMREEIVELYSSTENDKYIYAMLKHKKCCICGKEVTGPHHVDRVGTVGYKNDTGLDKRISPLCPYHHAEIESGQYTLQEFEIKYPAFGYILCDESQIKELKKIYKHHFKAFKEE